MRATNNDARRSFGRKSLKIRRLIYIRVRQLHHSNANDNALVLQNVRYEKREKISKHLIQNLRKNRASEKVQNRRSDKAQNAKLSQAKVDAELKNKRRHDGKRPTKL